MASRRAYLLNTEGKFAFALGVIGDSDEKRSVWAGVQLLLCRPPLHLPDVPVRQGGFPSQALTAVALIRTGTHRACTTFNGTELKPARVVRNDDLRFFAL